MDYPKFKYIENSKEVLQFSKKGIKCQCCEKIVNFYTDLIYCEEDVDVICDECIKSGKACDKFNGTFNDAEDIGNVEALNEIVNKTPVVPTYQEYVWPSCCDDMCVYLRRCNKKDFKDSKFLLDIQETFNDELIDFKELKKIPSENLLLFQCSICKKYHIIVDLD